MLDFRPMSATAFPTRMPQFLQQSVVRTPAHYVPAKLPNYREFKAEMKRVVDGRSDVRLDVTTRLRHTIGGKRRAFDSLKISSRDIKKDDPVMLIRAGIHGNEIHGPMTLFHHLDQIFEWAHGMGVKLVVFPLDNPSGYEIGERYNADGDEGSAGNNDFLRYRLKDGSIVDDLKGGNEFAEWYWSSDPALNVHLPQETRNLHRELKRLPLSQVRAVLDLHADNYLKGAYTYYYAFGDTSIYRPIIEFIQQRVPVLANVEVNSGFRNRSEDAADCVVDGKVVSDTAKPKTDDFGAIIRHDGSISDLFDRLGVEHSIAVEATAEVNPEDADWINLAWIYGLIEFVAARDHSVA